MGKYDPVLKERTDWSIMAQALAKETFDGRGPISLDLSEAKPEDIDYFARLHPGRMAPFLEAGIDLKKDTVKVIAQVKVSSSSGDGGIKIDTQCRTNIPGLYGAGSTCKNLVHGTYSVGGINLAWCCTTGYRAGASAAQDSLKAKDLPLQQKQVEALQQQILAPLEEKKGPLPAKAFKGIEEITEPAMRSLIKKADRIKSTLADLNSLEKADLKSIRARDTHELAKAHEAKNLVLLSTAIFRSALEREESRHSHYRQDFPYRDDLNWLKWVLIKKDIDKEVKVRIEPVPVNRYQVKPEQPGKIPARVKFD